MTPNKAVMFDERRLLTIGEQIKGLYYLPVKVQKRALALTSQKWKSTKEPTEAIKWTKVSYSKVSFTKENPSKENPNKENPTFKEQQEIKRAQRATLSLWHQRLGHISEKAVRYLLKDVFNEGTTPNHPIGALEEHFQKCEPCKRASFTNKVNKESRNASKDYIHLEKVASNIYRLISLIIYNRYRYFVIFLNKATRFLEGKLLYKKDKAFNTFTEF